jgi:hypothetical protein
MISIVREAACTRSGIMWLDAPDFSQHTSARRQQARRYRHDSDAARALGGGHHKAVRGHSSPDLQGRQEPATQTSRN